MPIFQLSERIAFPPPHLAEREGLLAVGGDLSPNRLLLAYKMGIFPWYSEEDPILWWSPDPRLVLYPHELKISKSLKKSIKKSALRITLDTAFDQVIFQCADVRLESGEGTWLVDEMIEAYCILNRMGLAHSVEAWLDSELVGGLYGLCLGRCFFGESMFSRISNASKIAFVSLVNQLKKWQFDIIDCQVKTDHLMRFGAREIPRKIFLETLEKTLIKKTIAGQWRFEP